jgi:cellulose synthase/poly-beta-1,6-N-acetylglucosamine synthase-like glycosyltransferase
VIAETLAKLQRAAVGLAKILVIADNCSDRTADIARAAGAETIERNDADRRGKGFALAFALQHLEADPPGVVIVIDADCEIDRSSLNALIDAAAKRPCQAINLLRPTTQLSPLVQVSNFAFMVKNLVRQRGLQRLADRVHLTGTGMALPWSLFASSELATTSIVEDLKLGLDLAERGHPPKLVANATVWSNASSEGGTLVQRRRWEGGFIAAAAATVPGAFKRGFVQLDAGKICAALDLCVPPLALLVTLNGALLVIGALVTLWTHAPWWPLVTQAILLGIAGIALIAVWFREGRQFVTLGALLQVPLYAIWKLPSYLGLTRATETRWSRSDRR